ncbi:MAG TPA: hypothetical protein VJV78_34515 [Polyangiales bacterium]|nr:hypothetical protein [Polyangiales bacterium]
MQQIVRWGVWLVLASTACTPVSDLKRPSSEPPDGSTPQAGDGNSSEAGVSGSGGDTPTPQAGVGGQAGAQAGSGGEVAPPMGGAGGSAGAAGSPGEPCASAGAKRCSMQGSTKRELCSNGVWTADEACPTGQVCSGEDAAIKCVMVEDLCRGSEGETVCTPSGTMIVCNSDASAGPAQDCGSGQLCQAGIKNHRCAKCIAGQDFRCTGKALEVCAPDGESYVAYMTCETEALCNAVAGTCTSATCAAGKFSCQANNLVQCNKDGTGFEPPKMCSAGMCDAAGGDCNICQPGQQSCKQDIVQTCQATGQGYDEAPCTGGMKCVGAGKCVACAADQDCAAMTKDCKVGACVKNVCVAENASEGKACTTSSRPGTCAAGGCVCTPQCDKACGDDGCGKPCPSKCSSGQTCVSDRCVDCTDDTQCKDSADGCQVGVCNKQQGTCSLTNVQGSPACRTSNNQPGTCSGGRCVCTPNCGASHCSGDNGCGGTCNFQCPSGDQCVNGSCSCVPRCSETHCSGDDGCDGSCNFKCPSNKPTCQNGSCTCIPKCSDSHCSGDDGCGGSCNGYSCPSNKPTCQNGSCVCNSTCSMTHCSGADGCGGSCNNSFTCPSSKPTCEGGSCVCNSTCSMTHCSGADGCGGSCNTSFRCPSSRPTCAGGECVCEDTCSSMNCGGPNGCNGTCNFPCPQGQECSRTSNSCVASQPTFPEWIKCSVSDDVSPCNPGITSCGSGGYCVFNCDAGKCPDGYQCIDGFVCFIEPKNGMCPANLVRAKPSSVDPIICARPGLLPPVEGV